MGSSNRNASRDESVETGDESVNTGDKSIEAGEKQSNHVIISDNSNKPGYINDQDVLYYVSKGYPQDCNLLNTQNIANIVITGLYGISHLVMFKKN